MIVVTSRFLAEQSGTNSSPNLHVDRKHKPSSGFPLFLLQHRVWPVFPQLWPHPPPESRCSRFHHSSPLHFRQDRFRRRCLHRAANPSDADHSERPEPVSRMSLRSHILPRHYRDWCCSGVCRRENVEGKDLCGNRRTEAPRRSGSRECFSRWCYGSLVSGRRYHKLFGRHYSPSRFLLPEGTAPTQAPSPIRSCAAGACGGGTELAVTVSSLHVTPPLTYICFLAIRNEQDSASHPTQLLTSIIVNNLTSSPALKVLFPLHQLINLVSVARMPKSTLPSSTSCPRIPIP